jgi:hypothetical protein
MKPVILFFLALAFAVSANAQSFAERLALKGETARKINAHIRRFDGAWEQAVAAARGHDTAATAYNAALPPKLPRNPGERINALIKEKDAALKRRNATERKLCETIDALNKKLRESRCLDTLDLTDFEERVREMEGYSSAMYEETRAMAEKLEALCALAQQNGLTDIACSARRIQEAVSSWADASRTMRDELGEILSVLSQYWGVEVSRR